MAPIIIKLIVVILILAVFCTITFFILRSYRRVMYKIFEQDAHNEDADKSSSDDNTTKKDSVQSYISDYEKTHKEHWWSTHKISFFPLYITILLHATLLTFYGNYMSNILIGYIGDADMFSIASIFNWVLLIPANLSATAVSCYRFKRPYIIASMLGIVFTLAYIMIIVSQSAAFLI